MSVQTKIFKNTGKTKINIVGVAELAAGAQISLTGENLPHVVLANYPGLVEITDDEAPAPKKGKTDE